MGTVAWALMLFTTDPEHAHSGCSTGQQVNRTLIKGKHKGQASVEHMEEEDRE